MSAFEINYGAVKITKGKYKGRIGLYDDDEGKKAIVYFGHMILSGFYVCINRSYLSEVTIHDLLERMNDIYRVISLNGGRLDYELKISLLNELNYVESIMTHRTIEARNTISTSGKKIFISHSSNDKPFVRAIVTDLSNAGHIPWLDEWNILVGESIPEKIEAGLNEADFVLVVLSMEAISSKWVEREWHSKYWDEISTSKIKVLPILFQDCEIPALLKMKKYADFRYSYNDGLDDVLSAIKSL